MFDDIPVVEILIILAIIILLSAMFIPMSIKPFYEAKIYNQHFKTSYTGWDFMFAGDTIKSYVNQGEQKTFNIKGLEGLSK